MARQQYLNDPSDPTQGVNIQPVQKVASSVFFEESAKAAIEGVATEAAVFKTKKDQEEIEAAGERGGQAIQALKDEQSRLVSEQQSRLELSGDPAADLAAQLDTKEGALIAEIQKEIMAIEAGQVQGVIPPSAVDARKRALARMYVNKFPFAAKRIRATFDTSVGGTGGSGAGGSSLAGQKSPQQKEMERAEAKLNDLMTTWGVAANDLYNPAVRGVFQQYMKDEVMRKVMQAGNRDQLTLAEQDKLLYSEVEEDMATVITKYKGQAGADGFLAADTLALARAEIADLVRVKEAEVSSWGRQNLLDDDAVNELVEDRVTRPYTKLLEQLESQGAEKVQASLLKTKQAASELALRNQPGMDLHFSLLDAGMDPTTYLKMENDIFLEVADSDTGKPDPAKLAEYFRVNPANRQMLKAVTNGEHPFLKIMLAREAAIAKKAENIDDNPVDKGAGLSWWGRRINDIKALFKDDEPNAQKSKDNLNTIAVAAVTSESERTVHTLDKYVIGNPEAIPTYLDNPQYATQSINSRLYAPNGIVNRIQEEAPGTTFQVMTGPELAGLLGVQPSTVPGNHLVAIGANGRFAGAVSTDVSNLGVNKRQVRGTSGARAGEFFVGGHATDVHTDESRVSEGLLGLVAKEMWFINQVGSVVDTSTGAPATTEDLLMLLNGGEQQAEETGTQSDTAVAEPPAEEPAAEEGEMTFVDDEAGMGGFNEWLDAGGPGTENYQRDGLYQLPSGALVTVRGGRAVRVQVAR